MAAILALSPAAYAADENAAGDSVQDVSESSAASQSASTEATQPAFTLLEQEQAVATAAKERDTAKGAYDKAHAADVKAKKAMTKAQNAETKAAEAVAAAQDDVDTAQAAVTAAGSDADARAAAQAQLSKAQEALDAAQAKRTKTSAKLTSATAARKSAHAAAKQAKSTYTAAQAAYTTAQSTYKTRFSAAKKAFVKKAVTSLKAKQAGTRSARISWKAPDAVQDVAITGYQIRYKTPKKWKPKAKTVTLDGRKVTASSLATAKYTASHYSVGRAGQTVRKITVHHMAGPYSLRECRDLWLNGDASSNYGIDNKGKVGIFVGEENRAWTSASPWNDNRAITIEVADPSETNFHTTDAAWDSLVDLCADVCARYGFRLKYTGGSDGTLTEHRMYSDTVCPGWYLHANMKRLAKEVNAELDRHQPKTVTVKAGSGTSYTRTLKKLARGTTYRFEVRAVGKAGTKTVYSSWSDEKSVALK